MNDITMFVFDVQSKPTEVEGDYDQYVIKVNGGKEIKWQVKRSWAQVRNFLQEVSSIFPDMKPFADAFHNEEEEKRLAAAETIQQALSQLCTLSDQQLWKYPMICRFLEDGYQDNSSITTIQIKSLESKIDKLKQHVQIYDKRLQDVEQAATSLYNTLAQLLSTNTALASRNNLNLPIVQHNHEERIAEATVTHDLVPTLSEETTSYHDHENSFNVQGSTSPATLPVISPAHATATISFLSVAAVANSNNNNNNFPIIHGIHYLNDGNSSDESDDEDSLLLSRAKTLSMPPPMFLNQNNNISTETNMMNTGRSTEKSVDGNAADSQRSCNTTPSNNAEIPETTPRSPNATNDQLDETSIPDYANAEILDRFQWPAACDEEVTSYLLCLVRPHEGQMAYREQIIQTLTHQVRLCLGVISLEQGYHSPLHCFLPHDPVRITVILSQGQMAYWHTALSDRLKTIVDHGPDHLSLTSGNNVDYSAASAAMNNNNGGNDGDTSTASNSMDDLHRAILSKLHSASLMHEVSTGFKVLCKVGEVDVEITANSRQEMSLLVVIEELNTLVGRNNLLKRSILLIRAWWVYESGSYLQQQQGAEGADASAAAGGSAAAAANLTSIAHFIPEQALLIMILAVFNLHWQEIRSPLYALFYFLQLYANYDGRVQAITLQGLVPFMSETSNQPALIKPQSGSAAGQQQHLISLDLLAKYWQLFNVHDALNQQPAPPTAALAAASTVSGEAATAAAADAGTASSSQQQSAKIRLHMLYNSMSKSLARYERHPCFNVLHPFTQSNLMMMVPESGGGGSVGANSSRLSSRRAALINTVFSKAYASLLQALQKILKVAKEEENNNSSNSKEEDDADAAAGSKKGESAAVKAVAREGLRSFFANVILRFHNSWRPDSMNNTIHLMLLQDFKSGSSDESAVQDPADPFSPTFYSSSFASLSLYEALHYMNFIVESVISESAILTFCIDLLTWRGPLPTGEVGKLLSESCSIPSLSHKLREKFGGLKKFMERYTDLFVFSNDHPFNPHVLLRKKLSAENLSLIDRGIFPIHLISKNSRQSHQYTGGNNKKYYNSVGVAKPAGIYSAGSDSKYNTNTPYSSGSTSSSNKAPVAIAPVVTTTINNNNNNNNVYSNNKARGGGSFSNNSSYHDINSTPATVATTTGGSGEYNASSSPRSTTASNNSSNYNNTNNYNYRNNKYNNDNQQQRYPIEQPAGPPLVLSSSKPPPPPLPQQQQQQQQYPMAAPVINRGKRTGEYPDVATASSSNTYTRQHYQQQQQPMPTRPSTGKYIADYSGHYQQSYYQPSHSQPLPSTVGYAPQNAPQKRRPPPPSATAVDANSYYDDYYDAGAAPYSNSNYNTIDNSNSSYYGNTTAANLSEKHVRRFLAANAAAMGDGYNTAMDGDALQSSTGGGISNRSKRPVVYSTNSGLDPRYAASTEHDMRGDRYYEGGERGSSEYGYYNNNDHDASYCYAEQAPLAGDGKYPRQASAAAVHNRRRFAGEAAIAEHDDVNNSIFDFSSTVAGSGSGAIGGSQPNRGGNSSGFGGTAASGEHLNSDWW